jgi:hypothetical protein
MKSLLSLTLVLLVGFSFSACGQSLADAQKAFDAGDYRAALKSIAESLSQKQSPLPPDQQYSLLMLKGEALLNIGERTYAIDAFNAASRAAADAHNIKNAALAKADAVLIQRSQGAVYKPAGDKDGINIVSAKTRPKAMQAAYDDLFAQYQDKFKAVLEGKSLPPMLQLVPTLGDLYVLESAATGEPKKTTEILKSFGLHARALMGKELERENRRVEELTILANSLIGNDFVIGTTLDRRGLWTPERRELEDIIDYVQKIQKAAQKGRQIAISFGFTGENWDGIIAQAGDVLDHAQELWDHRY